MKKLLVLITCLLTLNVVVEAQNYDRAIGLRFGFPTGITYKQFVSDVAAVEVILGGGRNVVGPGQGGGTITALLELHAEALDYSLNVVYGAGGHIGFWDGDLNLGVDGIFGLEYTPDAPIVFSLDIKPTLYWWRSDLNLSTGGAFSVRYAF